MMRSLFLSVSLLSLSSLWAGIDDVDGARGPIAKKNHQNNIFLKPISLGRGKASPSSQDQNVGKNSSLDWEEVTSGWERFNLQDCCKLLVKNTTHQDLISWSNTMRNILEKEGSGGDAIGLPRSLCVLGRAIRDMPDNVTNQIFKESFRNHLRSKGFVEIWEKKSLPIINDFNRVGFGSSLYAFSQLGIQPSRAFLTAWIDAAEQCIQTFQEQELSTTLYAFAMLGISPSDDFLKAWMAQAEQKRNFTRQGVCNSVFALALLNKESAWAEGVLREELIKLSSEISEGLYKDNDFSFGQLRSLYVAARHWKILDEIQSKTPCVNNALSALKRFSKTEERHELPSRLEKEVSSVLKGQGFVSECFMEKIFSPVDFYNEKKKLVIEVDGPQHFILSADGKLLQRFQDIFKDRLLQRYYPGICIARIPYYEWNKVEPKDRSSYVQNKIQFALSVSLGNMSIKHAPVPQAEAKGWGKLPTNPKGISLEEDPFKNTPTSQPKPKGWAKLPTNPKDISLEEDPFKNIPKSQPGPKPASTLKVSSKAYVPPHTIVHFDFPMDQGVQMGISTNYYGGPIHFIDQTRSDQGNGLFYPELGFYEDEANYNHQEMFFYEDEQAQREDSIEEDTNLDVFEGSLDVGETLEENPEIVLRHSGLLEAGIPQPNFSIQYSESSVHKGGDFSKDSRGDFGTQGGGNKGDVQLLPKVPVVAKKLQNTGRVFVPKSSQ